MIDAVVHQLSQLLSRGTGLPTRAGAAVFLMQLYQARPLQLAPHAPRLLKTLARAILDERSATARKAYASAAAHLARAAPAEQLGTLVRGLVTRYVGEDAINDEARLTVAALVRELQRGASEAMEAIRCDWLPLAFIGRHEPRWESEDAKGAKSSDEPGKLASTWHEAYDESGGNAGAVVSHLDEVLELLTALVAGTSWALRGAAACSLLELGEISGGAVMKREKAASTIRALADNLRARRYRDKERVAPRLDKLFPPSATSTTGGVSAMEVDGGGSAARKRQLEGGAASEGGGEEASGDM